MLLLLLVFMTVNVSVLVLRRDGVMVLLLTQTGSESFVLAGPLLILGALLYLASRAVVARA